MSQYSPINVYKLNKKCKDFLKNCERFREPFYASQIRVPSEIFNDLLEGICISHREHYAQSIPYKGKNLVRMMNHD